MKTKTKKILNIVAAALCATATAMCSACNTYHEHEYSSDWSYDANRHWHAATCEHTYETKDRAAHVFDEEGKTCVICGYQKPHEHEYAAEWSWDDDYHYHAPVCGDTEEVADKAEHTYDENGDCTECGAHHDHSFARDWKSDNTGHWHAATCKHSDIKGEFSPHVNEDENDLCDVCGYMLPHTHRFSEEWDWDGDQHFHRDTCGHGQITDVAPHEYKNGLCVCGKSKNELSITSSGKYAAYKISFGERSSTTLPLKDVPAGVYKLFCDRTDIKHTQDLKAVLPSALIATPKYESGSSSAVYSCKVYEDTDTYNPTYTGTLTIGEGATAIAITNSIGSMTCDVYLEKYTAPALEASETGTAYTKVTYPASKYGSDNQYKIPLGKSVVPGWYFLSVQYNYPKDSASLTAYVTVGDKVYRRSMGVGRNDLSSATFEVGIEIPEGETEISINHSFAAFNVEQVEIYLKTTKTIEAGQVYEIEVSGNSAYSYYNYYNLQIPQTGEYTITLKLINLGIKEREWILAEQKFTNYSFGDSTEIWLNDDYNLRTSKDINFNEGDTFVFLLRTAGYDENYKFSFKIDKK